MERRGRRAGGRAGAGHDGRGHLDRLRRARGGHRGDGLVPGAGCPGEGGRRCAPSAAGDAGGHKRAARGGARTRPSPRVSRRPGSGRFRSPAAPRPHVRSSMRICEAPGLLDTAAIPSRDRRLAADVAGALRAESRALSALAVASAADDRGAYAASRSRVLSTGSDLSGAVARLADAGFSVPAVGAVAVPAAPPVPKSKPSDHRTRSRTPAHGRTRRHVLVVGPTTGAPRPPHRPRLRLQAPPRSTPRPRPPRPPPTRPPRPPRPPPPTRRPRPRRRFRTPRSRRARPRPPRSRRSPRLGRASRHTTAAAVRPSRAQDPYEQQQARPRRHRRGSSHGGAGRAVDRAGERRAAGHPFRLHLLRAGDPPRRPGDGAPDLADGRSCSGRADLRRLRDPCRSPPPVRAQEQPDLGAAHEHSDRVPRAELPAGGRIDLRHRGACAGPHRALRRARGCEQPPSLRAHAGA